MGDMSEAPSHIPGAFGHPDSTLPGFKVVGGYVGSTLSLSSNLERLKQLLHFVSRHARILS